MKLLRVLFVFVLMAFPLGEIIRFSFGGGIIVKPLDVTVFIFVATWLVFKIIKKQKFRQKDILIPLSLFILSGTFPLVINNLKMSLGEIIASFVYLFRWVVYVAVVFAVSDFDKQFRQRISAILTVVGAVIVGSGYVQYFYYSDLHNLKYLGWDEHMYRMFSVFLDPNFAGAFFVLFFLFIINKFLKKKEILTGLLSLFALGAIFLTFSRSALIMLIISSCILFILKNKKKFIFVLFLAIAIVFSLSSSYFNIENINLFRVVSSEARLETARNALVIIEDNPIFGVGFNSYKYYQIKYGFRNETAFKSHADAAPDNSILFVLATTGIVGFVLYILFWYKILKRSSKLAVASVIGLFVNSLFINSLFYPFIMLWLWVIVALRENS